MVRSGRRSRPGSADKRFSIWAKRKPLDAGGRRPALADAAGRDVRRHCAGPVSRSGLAAGSVISPEDQFALGREGIGSIASPCSLAAFVAAIDRMQDGAGRVTIADRTQGLIPAFTSAQPRRPSGRGTAHRWRARGDGKPGAAPRLPYAGQYRCWRVPHDRHATLQVYA